MEQRMFQQENSCPAEKGRCNVVVVTSALHEFAESLGTAVDAKDSHTKQHSEEVAEVAYALALGLGLTENMARIVHIAAHLHDVGKIGVPDAVLRKTGALSREELALIRLHPVIGADIVRPVEALRECGVLEMILHHHERFDGLGYPDGLRGTVIPLGARIIAVADSFSAMLQSRPYRKALAFEEANGEITDHSGTQFDPAVVEIFSAQKEHLHDLVLKARAHAPGTCLTGKALQRFSRVAAK